jgi:RNA polymerase sigma-70 factor (ECF subfamily)
MSNHQIIERYYRAHRGELLAFVSARLHDTDAAEDLVQEAFLRMLKGLRPVNEETIGSLAYTLCRHQIIDWYRRRTIHNDVEHELMRTEKGTISAESVLSVREITEHLERGLARLPEACRSVYRMHIYGGLQAKDICKQTGENYKAVEYRLGMARKQVRNYLRHIS